MPVEEPSEAGDKVVSSAIVSTLNTFLTDKKMDFIRSNKLRKMICKQIPEATWTQFARCLEQVIKGKKDYEMDEKTGSISKSGSASSTSASASENEKTSNNDEKEANTTNTSTTTVLKTKNVKVPRAIALHLTRRGYLKKNNIEVNTKTKLTIHGIGATSEGLPLDEIVTVQVNRHCLDWDGTKPELDTDELATKHVNTAELLLKKMADSYKKHPDRFAPKKAGGTLEEQEQYAQEKQKAAAVRSTKKNTAATSKKREEQIPSGHAKKHSTKSSSKRKKEKFY